MKQTIFRVKWMLFRTKNIVDACVYALLMVFILSTSGCIFDVDEGDDDCSEKASDILADETVPYDWISSSMPCYGSMNMSGAVSATWNINYSYCCYDNEKNRLIIQLLDRRGYRIYSIMQIRIVIPGTVPGNYDLSPQQSKISFLSKINSPPFDGQEYENVNCSIKINEVAESYISGQFYNGVYVSNGPGTEKTRIDCNGTFCIPITITN
jgi:hypothetical protein